MNGSLYYEKTSKFHTIIEDLSIAFFAIITLLLIHFHEPWMDEAQAWLIARDVSNLTALVHQMGYEGSPSLWHMFLIPLAKLGFPYCSMSFFNFMIMLCAVTLFVKASPFPIYIKALFPFGYYILYEYTVIARSYSLTVLLLFIIAVLYDLRFNKPTYYAIAVFLLANTNLQSTIIAIALGSLFFYESIIEKKAKLTSSIIVAIILSIAILLVIYQLLPPSDIRPDLKSWNFHYSIENYANMFSNIVLGAFIPIKECAYYYWETAEIHVFGKTITHLWYNIFNSLYLSFNTYYLAFVLLIISLLIIILSLLFYISNKKLLLTFLLVLLGFMTIFIFKYMGSSRHFGLIFIFFIFLIWITSNYSTLGKLKLENRFVTHQELLVILVLMLMVHIVASITPLIYEPQYNFSSTGDAAMYLINGNYDNSETLIACYPYQRMIGILPYFHNQSKLYSIVDDDYYSFVIWKNGSVHTFNSTLDVVNAIDNSKAIGNYSEILMLLSYLEEDQNKLHNYKLIASFNNSTVYDPIYIYKRE